MEIGGAGSFPEDVRARIQYGDGFVALSGILSSYGAVSISRISTLMKGMFGVSISAGTIQQMVRRCAGRIRPVMSEIRDRIICSDVANFDETGLRVGGKLWWAHSSSTPEYTYQTISGKRGFEGMEENGVLP